ncbi:MAG: cob(I)yrinic acid a,c-diamide adenosyltransferase [Planctomycetaceae bacterium]|jgi:cob(I)alamin adenosyltransferase|nr:cob(I)yrinic acid a,c-diamide adenosyltransferase [Planctomycetaceae bacterium]
MAVTYTRSGDTGDTSLSGGVRVRKDDRRIEICGCIDELSASLGLVRTEGLPPHREETIVRIQHELFGFCAEIAAAKKTADAVSPEHVARLEEEIDRMEAVLPPLKQFIVPGADRLSAALHFSRTVCRRAERAFTSLPRSRQEYPVLAAYLNRLSDWLFVLARTAEAGFPQHVSPSSGTLHCPLIIEDRLSGADVLVDQQPDYNPADNHGKIGG